MIEVSPPVFIMLMGGLGFVCGYVLALLIHR
jgi:hypothetical protein